jgi:hypothetical protein
MLLISFSILLTASAVCCSSITHIKSWPEHGCDGMASRAQPTARPNPRTPVKKRGRPNTAGVRRYFHCKYEFKRDFKDFLKFI